MFRHCKDIIRMPESNKQSNVPKVLIKCDFCEDGWESETDLMLHKKEHVDLIYNMVSDGMQLCWNCIKKYKNKAVLYKHIWNAHFLSSDTATRIEREIFICNECENLFFDKQMLTYHIMRRHKFKIKSNSVRFLKCQKINSQILLKSHLFFSHQVYSILYCPLCYIKCSNSEEFKSHVDSHLKHYHCTICNYTCSSSEYFKKHCDEHEQTKPSNFETHNKDYINNFFVPKQVKVWSYQAYSPLKGLQIQRGLKICILCREICKNQKAMVKHLMHHTGIYETTVEKPNFSCECGQTFNYGILLKQHRTKCKTDRNEKEKICSQVSETIVQEQKS